MNAPGRSVTGLTREPHMPATDNAGLKRGGPLSSLKAARASCECLATRAIAAIATRRTTAATAFAPAAAAA